MPSSRKKVLVRRFLGDVLAGYLPQSGLVNANALELLDLSGRILPVPLPDVKMVSFVRDFNLSDTQNPERLTRRTFLARPRTEGLWVRITFRTNDLLEGLAPTDKTLVDSLADDAGLLLTPPDTRSNTQRIYVPRTAFTDFQVLAVITSAARRKPVPSGHSGHSGQDLQDELFHLPFDPDSRPN